MLLRICIPLAYHIKSANGYSSVQVSCHSNHIHNTQSLEQSTDIMKVFLLVHLKLCRDLWCPLKPLLLLYDHDDNLCYLCSMSQVIDD